ncbi:FadR/GntR family transcriptional regulator [Noviherbaspirillum sp. CPCC 100848]|uniref:FadR/GntR family transcriptional regulator n=1 Tax=Noviherbaspirillum album TaxID=3080276 RepID=A0ABU6J4P8_9BURK|nr:FadR/GntR family transcriptional regulator [Noviherbaspirillum sp. CPCC 100848]MEC4718428.1 FadR/GntR family transcriptional regulator [Noviherbaspirillum sp. CPCC 100848]
MAHDQQPSVVRRLNLVETVQKAIVEAIKHGEFKVGECLPTEQQLSMRYGVSRPTMREALVRLRAKSPFLSRQGHRTHIDFHPDVDKPRLSFSDISCIEDFKKCYEFRCSIEAGSARFAALNRNDDDIERIWQAFHLLHGQVGHDEMPVDADFAFHTSIASAAGNPLFLTMLTSIHDQVLFVMDLSRKFSHPRQLQRMAAVEEEHRRVVESIVRKDPAAAEAAMRLHIDNSVARVLGI